MALRSGASATIAPMLGMAQRAGRLAACAVNVFISNQGVVQ